MDNGAAPYWEDPVYRELARLCREAGMRIEYAAIPAVVYARSRDTLIQMPLDPGRFTSAEHACVVLGHELAHALVNPGYPEATERADLARHMLIESECDRLGTYLYLLARRMAAPEA